MKRTKQPNNLVINKEAQNRMIMNAVTSIIRSRMSLSSSTTYDGKRDVYNALGYPQLDGISYDDYYLRYRRQDIAKAIVEKPVTASWRKLPIIRGYEDENNTFRDIWEELEKDKKIYSKLIRADIVSGIGRYGILLLGFNDGEDQQLPVTKATELLYIQPFSENNAEIKTYDLNPQSKRYGLPETYSLTVIDQSGTSSHTQIVHYSRVIHIAENLLESNIYGLPRLEVGYNRLLNLELIVGGSAEMFWQGAFPGMAFKADPEVDLSSIASTLTDEIEKYVHKLERYMKLQGIDVQNLSPSVADPTAHIDVQLKMLSIAYGIPKRILEGSERGELSSSQDTEAWDDKMDHRRNTYVEINIIRPVIDKLIEVGIINEPQQGYYIEWPDLSAPSDKEKAETGRIKTEAITKYAGTPDTQYIVPIKSFLEEILELPIEKVERIMKEVEEVQKIMEEQLKEEDNIPNDQNNDDLGNDQNVNQNQQTV